MATHLGAAMCLAGLLALMACAIAPAAEPADGGVGEPFVRVFDTGAPAKEPLTDAAIVAKRGWTQVPEDTLLTAFKGDAVLMNDRLAAVLSPGATGAVIYSRTGDGWNERASLAPTPGHGDAQVNLQSVRLLENTAGAVLAEGSFRTFQGGTALLAYRLTTGQGIVEARPGSGTAWLWIRCPVSYVVVPDFFGNDMVFGLSAGDMGRLGLPAENFLINLIPDQNAAVVCAWQPRNLEAWAVVSAVSRKTAEGASSNNRNRWLGVTQIQCIRDARIWVAFLEGSGLWHERAIGPADEGKTVALDWRPPFSAKWRADFVKAGGTADSVEFKMAADTGQVAGEDKDPPCRIDADRATVRMPSAAGAAPGGKSAAASLVVYPLDRTRDTPLTVFTPVDVMRSTLGVGPCQYILEAEGLASQDNPTPDQVMTWVEKQFKKKKDREAEAEIRDRLKAMVELVGRTQMRINRYAESVPDMRKVLDGEAKTPAVAEAAQSLRATLDSLEETIRAGRSMLPGAGQAGPLADRVAGLIGKDGATAECQRLAAEVRAIGAAQDRTLSQCRMAVRWLIAQCRTMADGDPSQAGAAKMVRERAEKVLQNQ
jgi:hypothetical protein